MRLVREYVFKPFLLVVLLLLYCEFVHYYVVLLQCRRPYIPNTDSKNVLNAMLLADTHLLGPHNGHWFDKLRREWQMHRAFQTAMALYRPEVVFFLGDVFDEGQTCTDEQFRTYVKRFYSLFGVNEDVNFYVAVGNHDVGFHYWITSHLLDRFTDAFLAKPVNFVTIKQNHFILLNSMAMEMDGCGLCQTAESEIQNIGEALTCAQNSNMCNHSYNITDYSQPILLQHFPLFRESDANCSEPDEAPPQIKNKKFRQKWDCLSRTSTNLLFRVLNPRLIFTGHTHHGCYNRYANGAEEWTLSSFSWRNKNNPSFALVAFHPEGYAIEKCYMPHESTVIYLYVVGGCFITLWIVYKVFRSNRRRNVFTKLAKVG